MEAARHEDETRTTAGTVAGRLVKIIVAAALIALIALALLRVFITPVAPTQQAPLGHPQLSCPACHIVSDSIDEVEVP